MEKIEAIEGGEKLKKISWSNVLGNRRRPPFLLLIKDGKIKTFEVKAIPETAVVKGSDYQKRCVWTGSTFELVLSNGVRDISGKMGWEQGTFLEGLASATASNAPRTWSEISEVLGVPIIGAMKFLREKYPSEAKNIDEVEDDLAKLDDLAFEEGFDYKRAVVSFGSPTNRQIADGYWKRPKIIGWWWGFFKSIFCFKEIISMRALKFIF